MLGEQRPHLSVIIFQISIPNRRRTRPHGYVSAKSIQIWAIRPPPPPFSAGTVVGRKRWRWRSAELFVIAGCFSYLKLLDIGHSGSPLDRSRQMTDQGVCAISVKLKCLRCFNILWHGYLSSSSIESLSSNCPLLSDPISVPAFPTVAVHTWITFPLTSRACVFIVACIG